MDDIYSDRFLGSGSDLGHSSTSRLPDEVLGVDRTLLIVDDDKPFRTRLTQAMEGLGFVVVAAASVSEAYCAIESRPPAFAVIDLNLPDGNGLSIISKLKSLHPGSRCIILSGYANIQTAVTSIKLGAADYLAKPTDADAIFQVLMSAEHGKIEAPKHTLSANRIRFEHIHSFYEACEQNVSETARRLNMHRRTLQRILAKRAPQ